eukprot:7455766-Heterocapsa_arctica.AAC.1
MSADSAAAASGKRLTSGNSLPHRKRLVCPPMRPVGGLWLGVPSGAAPPPSKRPSGGRYCGLLAGAASWACSGSRGGSGPGAWAD